MVMVDIGSKPMKSYVYDIICWTYDIIVYKYDIIYTISYMISYIYIYDIICRQYDIIVSKL